MAGMLFLCATPIGNLEDITSRVVRTLGEVDVIAAEDTRNTLRLLNHFGIKAKMTSYHEYNKVEKAYQLVQQMKDGQDIALVTDAGTPAISDPGEVLVRMCREEGITVTSLPGACACITALILSGFNTRRFVFEGFLPPDKKERRQVLEDLKTETRTTILYEAPHHLVKTLEELLENLGNRRLTLCRELTKKFEEVRTATIEEAIDYYKSADIKGEFVLVLEGRNRQEMVKEEQEKWVQMSVEEHVEYYVNQGRDKKEAMKMAAKDRGVTKREIYAQLHQE